VSKPNEFLGAQKPTVYLETCGPASLSLGQPLAYEIIARNLGGAVVAKVQVDNELPAAARFLSAEPQAAVRDGHVVWQLGSLEPGAERRLRVQIQPAQEGEFIVRATATFSAASCAVTQITRPRLSLSVTGPESVQVGDPVVFRLRISNIGTGAASRVMLHDQLPAGLCHEQGTHIEADLGQLAPGETREVTLPTTAAHPGSQLNEIVVTGADGLEASAKATVVVTQANLLLREIGPQRRYLNRQAEYTLEIVNDGNAPAPNVALADRLPEGLEFVAAGEGGKYEPKSRTVCWALGSLAAGQKRSVSVRVTARAPGDLVIRAVARADRDLEAKAESSLHVEGIPALLLEVVDSEDPIEVGAETIYEIRVQNQGTSASTSIQIIATVPKGMAARGASGPTPHRLEGTQVIFEPLGRLAPRADALYRVRVVGQEAGDLRFKVQLTADHLSQPVVEEESTRVYRDN
jgi:uncharacterized repeat protein (TIGR01451 family)